MLLKVGGALCDGSVFLMPSEIPEMSNLPHTGGYPLLGELLCVRRPPHTSVERPVVRGSRHGGPCRWRAVWWRARVRLPNRGAGPNPTLRQDGRACYIAQWGRGGYSMF